MFLYTASRVTSEIYFTLAHGLRVFGREHVPLTGGVIFAANHASFYDPPLLGAAVKVRHVAFIAKSELGSGRLLNWYIRNVGGVFIRRGSVNLELERAVSERLREGDGIGIFPEGTRTRTGALGPGKAGVGRLVLLTGAPVVPLHIHGTREAWPPGRKLPRPGPRITVRIGPPLTFAPEPRPEKARCQAVVDEIIAAIRALGESDAATQS